MTIRFFLILLPILFGSCGVVKQNRIASHNERYLKSTPPGSTRFQVAWSKDYSDQIYLEPAQLETARPILVGKELLVSYSSGLFATFSPETGVLNRKINFSHHIIGEMIPVAKNDVLYFASDGALYRFSVEKNRERVLWKTPLENEQVISSYLRVDDLVIFKTSKERLYGVNINSGEVAWLTRSYQSDSSFTIDNNLSPVIVGDQVMAGFANGKIVLFNHKNGKSTYELTISSAELFNEIVSSCTVNDSIIYIPSFQKGIVAFDYKLKTVLWETKQKAFSSLLPLNKTEGVYVSDKNLLFINLSTGKIIQKLELNIDRPHTLKLLQNRYLLLGSYKGGLTMIDLHKKPLKGDRFYLSSGISRMPEIAGRKMFLLSNSGHLYRINLIIKSN